MEQITLYKKDHKGQLRVWTISADDDEIVMEYGVEGGELIERYETVEDGLAGRTLDEQILSRINSRVNKKLDKGYIRDREEAVNAKARTNVLGFNPPMLAGRYDKLKNKIDWTGALAQYKYNGHRCMITNDGGELVAYSRNGKIIDTIDHILENINIPEGTTIDGELYCHGIKLQTISSWVKRKQPSTSRLKFMCYDLISDESYEKRLNQLRYYCLGMKAEIVPCFQNVNSENVMDLLGAAIDKGYEGLMVRCLGEGYRPDKRSNKLIKVKRFLDDEFLVVEINESKDGWAILTCVLPDGKTFDVSAPGNIPEKTAVLLRKHDFIGRKVTVEYAELTELGKPFHPVAKRWRAKESE